MEPLAKKLEPKSLNDVLGQKHLIGKGAILRNLVEKKKLVSMILYGKPGIGKTSIAKSIVNDLDKQKRRNKSMTYGGGSVIISLILGLIIK